MANLSFNDYNSPGKIVDQADTLVDIGGGVGVTLQWVAVTGGTLVIFNNTAASGDDPMTITAGTDTVFCNFYPGFRLPAGFSVTISAGTFTASYKEDVQATA